MGGRLTERERSRSNVQVVVNETLPPSGESLRSILEAGGFDVVGTTSSPEELRHFLASADPQVVVFDAGTSVTTVAETREAAPDTGLVVVWPAGVTASVADLKVEPWRAEFDLGNAVRAACVRHAPAGAQGPVAIVPPQVFETAGEAEQMEPTGVGPFEPTLVPSLTLVTAASAPQAAAPDKPAPDPSVTRRRANLALLFAAASFAVLVLLVASQLAAQHLTPSEHLALPSAAESQTPILADSGEPGIALLSENPAQPPTATSVLLTQSLSGGLATPPSQSGTAAPSGGSLSGGGTSFGPGAAPSHGGGLSNGGPSGGGSPGNGGTPPPTRNGPPTSNRGKGKGRPGGGGNPNGGTSHGHSGSTSHGQSGSTSHGQSGSSHGQSSTSHGQSGTSHGQSGSSHGQSSQSHGKKPN